jgi:phage terminase small subunit
VAFLFVLIEWYTCSIWAEQEEAMTKLTQKQENFCLAYIELGNKSKAYAAAYSTENMKPETIHKRADELFNHGGVSGRIAKLKEEHRGRHNMTEARQLAFSIESPAPAVSATMGKAKLLGLDKQVVEHTGNLGPLVIVVPDE